MKKKLMTLLLALCCATSLFAQPASVSSFTVKGQVIDSLSNESVPYATMKFALAASPQQAVKMLATDDDGKFEAILNAPGDYVVTIQFVGKLPAEKKFTLTANDKTKNLGIVYMAENTQQLEQVTVTAQKPLVRVDIDKLTYSLEEDPESKVNNTLEMLRKVPMVTVDGEDKIQLKGSSNFKIYMNGKPSNMLSSNNASDVLKSMPASSVKDIEVITDPGAKYDAEGIGGVINIITHKTSSMQGVMGTVNANVGSFGSYGVGGNLTTKIGKLGITGYYNFNEQRRPWGEVESTRENIGPLTSLTTQKGRSKSHGPFQYGTLEISYEIDSLNLLSVGGNIYRGDFKSISEYDVLSKSNMDFYNYSYLRKTDSDMDYGSIDVNVDFQHSTHKKDELLTFSYRFSNQPDNSESYSHLYDMVNFYDSIAYPKWSKNDAHTNEHTAQIDYTTPTGKNQTLEAGLKYIMRENNSESFERIFRGDAVGWVDTIRPMRDLNHLQHIYSGYFSYAWRLKNFGFKAGVRAEGTSLNVKYPDSPEANFKNNYFDVVPNATVSYMIDMTQQLRFGYNMRIYRPGIWYLNPYVNNIDPQNISYGNPNLNSEKSHGFNLNYSMFRQKFNLNASVNYSFVNNSIERVTFVDESTGVNVSTYENIGKSQSLGLFLYGRWSPLKWFNVSLNGGASYANLDGGNTGYANKGWGGQAFGYMQFILPKDFNIGLNAGAFFPPVQLQSKTDPYSFSSISINKSFLNKNLTVSLSCQNPLQKNMTMKSSMTGTQFNQESINRIPMREVRLRVSYRFGTLKEQVKKVRRGISNDDTKAGGSGSGSTGGSVEGQVQ
ncbi:outer membrane receptor protein involved in Fe transport [Parabacteroides sp. PFB2-10]|uniref:outer membrane beta-barrel family protein n=1 Tax=Parabacteroides sp. PFB2-10 TaxID=1742405 RepID=UPI0024749C7F|nr:outer membrane beta-barrel family protein [Parabacteroides sp. PFB2-10]MDH6313396.1 outer membrane receptor protein involved in Fe transport [Parabacteroides sp. PFB2-10]MDL2244864.1 TonB-dependent receptor [Parabacteroides sp. OttesenSCG-928-J18]